MEVGWVGNFYLGFQKLWDGSAVFVIGCLRGKMVMSWEDWLWESCFDVLISEVGRVIRMR